MHRRYYSYAGLNVTSELALPEWAEFEQPQPTGDMDVVITLAGALDPDLTLQGEQSPANRSRDRNSEIASPSTLAMTPVITADEFRLHVPETGDYYVHHGREIVVTPAVGAGAREVRLFLLGTAWGALCYQRGALSLHASVVQLGNGAIAFCGPTGSGKSTIAAWMLARGARLVGDDLCRFEIAGREAHVFPAAPRLKLWRDALDRMGRTTDDLERDHFRMDKFHLPAVRGEQYFRAAVQTPLRLHAIYLLEWGETGLTRLTGTTALRRLVQAATYRGELLEPMGRLAEHWQRCADLARSAPIFRFARPRDWNAMEGAIASLVMHAQNILTIPANRVILSSW